tara:strand:+ start:139 stop:684 length:546 start_codon:yes stop_codon:yes gene_type:complete
MGNGKKSGIAARFGISQLMRSRNLFTYDDVVELFKQYRFTATDAYEIVEDHIEENLFGGFSAETYTLAAVYLDLEKKSKNKSDYFLQREVMRIYPRLVDPELMNFHHIIYGDKSRYLPEIHGNEKVIKTKKYKIFHDKNLRNIIRGKVKRVRDTKPFMRFYKSYWPHGLKKLLKKRFGPKY